MNINNYQICNWGFYLASIISISIFMRFIVALLQSLEVTYSNRTKSIEIENFSFTEIYFSFLKGRNPVTGRHDLFYNFALGSIELLIYPILIGTNNIEVVGAWLGFKALAQWGKWNEERLIYNRFLLANIIIVTASYLLATQFVLIEK